jgi:hypothetical protein
MPLAPFLRDAATPAGDVPPPHSRLEALALPFTDPRLETAYHYWQKKSGDSGMPRRADIDPTEIPKLLPDVMLVDVMPDRRYRYRLIGTENARAHGINATGRYLDDVLPGDEYKTHVIRLYDECVRERRALYSECLFLASHRQEPERHTKVLFMPLSEDGESVNIVFVVQLFVYIARATRDRHFLDAPPYREITHILL